MKHGIIIVTIALFTGIAFLGFTQQKQPETQPLIPMMQMLLANMQTVDQGIYTENFELIAKGAAAIADHPKMTQKDKRIIKKTLGEEMKKFVAFDMTVHHHADSMRMAALQKKNAGDTSSLSCCTAGLCGLSFELPRTNIESKKINRAFSKMLKVIQ